jgi:O-antigen ligase
MAYQPTTLENLRPLRRPPSRPAERAGWAAVAGSSSVLVGVLASAAPMVLFGLAGIIGSAIAFLSWPTLTVLGILLIRPTIDDTAQQLVLGPANALGAIGIAVFVGGGAYLVLRGPRIRVPVVTAPFVAFLAVGLATVRYAPTPSEALGFWMQLCTLLVMFCLGLLLFRTPSALKKVVAVVLASAVLPTIVALYQLASGTNLEPGKGSAAAAPGTISHPNGLSFFLMLALAVGLVVALEGPPRRLRVPLGIGLALGAGAFIGTYTRSAWVGLAFVLAVIATVQYRRIFLIGGVALVALAIAVPSTVTAVEERFSDLSPSSASYSTNSFQWRLENWSRMAPYATDRPLTGHGLGSYLPLSDEEFGRFDYDFIVPSERPGEQVVYAHNDYLFLAVEMGIPGAVLWLSIFVGLIVAMARARACPAVRPLATALLAVVAATAVGSAVDNVVLYTVVLLPLMALCGAVAGVHQEWRRNEPGGAA